MNEDSLQPPPLEDAPPPLQDAPPLISLSQTQLQLLEQEKQRAKQQLMLLAEHSTIADMSQLRELSPDTDAAIRLKLYSNANSDDDWFKTHIVVGESPEQALANAVFRSLAANTGSYNDPEDVSVETVTATFFRLICYYNNNALFANGNPSDEWKFSEQECLAFAETYTLLHFIRNNYSQHVREIFKAAMDKAEFSRMQSALSAAAGNDDDNDVDDKQNRRDIYNDTPHWYRLLINDEFVNKDTPYSLLNNFYKRHAKTIELAVPLSFAVRLFHFALVHEAYAVVGVLLSMQAMTNALPLAIGRRLATHLSTRLDFTQSMQEKEADKVNLFIPEERAAKFKADLATLDFATLWPALSYMSDWQQANIDAQKHVAVRKTLDTIESADEQVKVAEKIIDTDAARRVEQCKLAASQVAKELRFAVEARERARGGLLYVQKVVGASCEILSTFAHKGDKASAVLLDQGVAYLQEIQEFLEEDDAWFEQEYHDTPKSMPTDHMQRQLMIGNAEREHVMSLQKYISVQRRRMLFVSAELQHAVDEQQQAAEATKDDKILELKRQLEAQNAASYFGDED